MKPRSALLGEHLHVICLSTDVAGNKRQDVEKKEGYKEHPRVL